MNKNFQLTFNKDQEDKYKRVLVEHKVKTIEPLIKFQNDISKVNSNFQPHSPEKLHLTLVHFGIPLELYEDFTKTKQKLTLEQFLEQFYDLIEKVSSTISKFDEMEVQAEKLDIFGTFPHHVAAVKVVRSPEIMQWREGVNHALYQFVRNFGFEEVHQFMLQSPNLRYNPQEIYNPHITLGYVGEDRTLPKIEISGLQLVLNSPVIVGM